VKLTVLMRIFDSIASGKEGESTQIAKLPEKLSITEIIASSPEAFYSENKLPPVPGKSRHNWKQSPEQEKADPGMIYLSLVHFLLLAR